MENSEKNKIKKRVEKIIFMFFLLLILSALSVSLYYNYTLQNQIYERDVLIEKLTRRDSILNQIIDLKYDSITGTTSYSYLVRGGKVLKYNNLAIELEKTEDEYNQISERNKKIIELNSQNKSDYNSLSNSFNKLNKDYIELAKKHNLLIDSYNKNIKEDNRIINQFNQKSDSLSSFKIIVSLTQKYYDIKYNINLNGNVKKISLKSEKLDSALILLPYFRDRLQFDDVKKVWIINTSKRFRE